MSAPPAPIAGKEQRIQVVEEWVIVHFSGEITQQVTMYFTDKIKYTFPPLPLPFFL